MTWLLEAFTEGPRPVLAVSANMGDDENLSPDFLAECEKRIGYVFHDKELLRCALTHASGAGHRLASNERLEFLGDAILGFIVCDILFRRFPEALEGELTCIKSVVVSRRTCAKISKALGMDEFLILGKGMANGHHLPSSLLANVFESLLGAIYLDGGEGEARAFVHRHVGADIDAAATGDAGGNYKSILQQLAQREHGATPTYQLLDEKGPDHSKCFEIAAQVGKHRFPPAWGRNKKEAEQRAAYNALSVLRGEPAPFSAE